MRSSTIWRSVGAVRRDGIIVVDTLLVGRPGARLGEAATVIARLLHPNVAGLP